MDTYVLLVEDIWRMKKNLVYLMMMKTVLEEVVILMMMMILPLLLEDYPLDQDCAECPW